MKKIFILCALVISIAVKGPFITHAVASFFVGDNGYVGIHTNSPQHPLDVDGAMYSRLVTSTTTAIDWNSGNVQSKTLSSNPTLTFSNAQAGGEYKLILNQDATGGRTVTWPNTVVWSGGLAPTLTSTASSTDIASFVYDGSHYLGLFEGNFTSTSPLATSLVSYWKLDNNSNDAVGGNNGSDTGVTYVTGKINDGADFNSSSDVIDIGNPSNLQITGPISVSFWYKAAQTNNTTGRPLAIVGKADDSTQFSWEMYQDTGTLGMQFFFSAAANGANYRFMNYSLPDTNWHHWVVTFDPTTNTGTLYLDGSSVSPTYTGTWSGTTLANSTAHVTIGNKSSPNTSGGNGTVDEVGIWSRILSAGEVTSLYNSSSGNQYPF